MSGSQETRNQPSGDGERIDARDTIDLRESIDREHMPPGRPRSLRRRRARWFFSRLAIVLAICVLAIQAVLTVVLLRKDTIVPGEAELTIPAALEQADAPASAEALPERPTLPLPEPSPAPVAAPPDTRSDGVPASAATASTAAPVATPQLAGRAQDRDARPASLPGIVLEIAAAELALQSGQFDAALDYGNGVRSTSRASFDLGGGQREPRIHITTSYTNADTIQNSEQILVGERAWHREAADRWTPLAQSEGLWGQMQSFLPHVVSASNPEITRGEQSMTLRWYDPRADVDVTLEVDPATGTPRRLQRASRSSSQTLTVIYSGWNTPVEITPPPEQ